MATSANARARSLAPLPVRAHPLVLGAVLFLASELMFFAALFAAYYELRANRAQWPPPMVRLDTYEAGFGTLLLFAASAVMVLATRAMDGRRFRAARCWTVSAIVAAIGFVLVAVHGYSKDAFTIATNAYGSIYYAMTGFHLLHVIAGIGILIALLVGMRSRALSANQRAGAEAMTYYWHFVFIVWLGIFGTVYFVR
ncbi:MAG: cytochrome c oxidase subunit 3 [Candidatus Cybelea sp.]